MNKEKGGLYLKEMQEGNRRNHILKRIKTSEVPLTGTQLAKEFSVSRQIIVQDIALLRAEKHQIIATRKGYFCETLDYFSRVFKVRHTDENTEKELLCIVDLSGEIKDVFVEHTVYGNIHVDLNITSHQDIEKFMQKMKEKEFTQLKNITNDYHYHTVEARSLKLLDLIEFELNKMGFLVNE